MNYQTELSKMSVICNCQTMAHRTGRVLENCDYLLSLELSELRQLQDNLIEAYNQNKQGD